MSQMKEIINISDICNIQLDNEIKLKNNKIINLCNFFYS